MELGYSNREEQQALWDNQVRSFRREIRYTKRERHPSRCLSGGGLRAVWDPAAIRFSP